MGIAVKLVMRISGEPYATYSKYSYYTKIDYKKCC